jgi:hypothetical protein
MMRKKPKPPTDAEIRRLNDEVSPLAAVRAQLAAGVPVEKIKAPKSVWVEWIRSQGWKVPKELL